MKRYMINTNIVSHIIKNQHSVIKHLTATPMEQLSISAITSAELRFGLAKRPEAKRLHHAVNEFLKCVDILSWSDDIADTYATIRARMEQLGKVLAPLDMLIAAHALATDSILVSNDKAFRQVTGLKVVDWL